MSYNQQIDEIQIFKTKKIESMKINYQVKTNAIMNKSAEVEDPNFICVRHYVDGIARFTAFIGKREGDLNKRVVTISPSGGILEIHRMYGSTENNATELLKKSGDNEVIPNRDFLDLYAKESKSLMVQFGKEAFDVNDWEIENNAGEHFKFYIDEKKRASLKISFEGKLLAHIKMGKRELEGLIQSLIVMSKKVGL